MKNKLFRIRNLDQLFNDTINKRVINNSDFTNSQVMEDFVKQFFYETDKDLEYVSSCECGECYGTYFEGSVCPYCGTVVSSKFTTALNNVNWFDIPEHLPAVLHPVFFTIFKEWLGKTKSIRGARTKKVPIIQAILNPADTLPEELRCIVPIQGQSYFNEHIFEILHYFLHEYKPKKGDRWNPYIEYLIEKHKDGILTRKLPILHPSFHPLAKDGKAKTVDMTAAKIVPAWMDLSQLGNTSRRKVVATKYVDKTLWKIYSQYIDYIELIIQRKLGDKFAQLRRHNTGSRIHFSARSVIVPITERHMGSEIYLPAKIAINSLKYEIINFLMKNGYSYTDAVTKQVKSLVTPDPEVFDIIKKIIKMWQSRGFEGIAILVGRNPRADRTVLAFY